MSAKYFIRDISSQQTLGPYDLSTLKTMASNDSLTKDRLLCQENSDDWLPASQIPDLFPSLPPKIKTSSTVSKTTFYLTTVTLIAISVGIGVFALTQSQVKVNEQDNAILAENNRLRERIASLEDRLDTQNIASRLLPTSPPHRGKIDPNIPDSSWTIARLLTAYLEAPTWPERLPLVKDPENVRSHMEKYYSAAYTPPASFHINLPSNTTYRTGESVTVKVEIGNTTAAYVLVQTRQGLRVDWLASQKLRKQLEAKMAELQDKAFMDEWNLHGAQIDATALRIYQFGETTRMSVEIVNHSQAFIGLILIKGTVYNAKGEYLAHTSIIESNIRPGATTFSDALFLELNAARISSWKLMLEDISITKRSGERLSNAIQWFTFRELKN